MLCKDMVPALVGAIKSQGLALVIDRSDEPIQDPSSLADPFPQLPEGVDGVMKSDGVLRFNESINM